MNKLFLGERSIEVLHSAILSFPGSKGETITMYRLTVLIDSLVDAPITGICPVNIPRGKTRLQVSVTGKAKDELKFSFRPVEDKGGKVA